jgi:hypothetical protein
MRVPLLNLNYHPYMIKLTRNTLGLLVKAWSNADIIQVTKDICEKSNEKAVK